MASPSEFWAEIEQEDYYAEVSISPPLSGEALHDWESKHGVALPTTLAQALMVQNGGYVRDTDDDIILQSIDSFTPLTHERWRLVEDNQRGALLGDRSKMFVIGDYLGCAVVLDYNVGPEPRVLSIWHDFMDELRDGGHGSFDQFLQNVRERCQSEQDEQDAERSPTPDN